VGVDGHMALSAITVMESCGLWGCILAGILAARLAQLSVTTYGSLILSNSGCLGTYITMNWITINFTQKCRQNSLRCVWVFAKCVD